MIRIDIKPLSVNDAWQGKRFKTKEYKVYEKILLLTLPKFRLPEAPYHIHYEFGFSNMRSDVDNPIKCLSDILSKKYGFNDSSVHSMSAIKVKVDKGKEYFKVDIVSIDK